MGELWVPREYQKHGIEFILNSDDGCALWFPMGLGKTTTAATALQRLLYDFMTRRRVLIVGPKRVAYKAWPDEFRKWDHLQWLRYRLIRGEDFGLTPSRTTVDKWHPVTENIVKTVKKGKLQFGYDAEDDQANRQAKAATKKCLQAMKERIHIVSWDFLPYLEDAYGDNWPYDLVVLDESSFVKNQDTERFRSCRRLAKKTRQIVELTGTPSTRSLLDVWTQVFLLDGGRRLGETFGGFRTAFFTADKMGYAAGAQRVFSWKADKGAREAIYSLVGDVVMSLDIEDWLDMPELIENRIMVELPEKAREFYDEIEAQLIAQINGATVRAASSATLFGKCLQIANGTVYDDEKISHSVHSAKFDALAELVEATPGSLLVAYSYRPEILRLQKYFGKKARAIQSDKDIDDWNAGKIKLGYAHPAGLGHGLNLQDGGSNVCWLGPPPNLEHWLQLNKRLHRPGQQADRVIINVLMAENTLDEHVRDVILQEKDDSQNDLLAAVRARIDGNRSPRR